MSKMENCITTIESQPGFLSACEQQTDLLATKLKNFVDENGCLITLRHDYHDPEGKTIDYLVNTLHEIVALHVDEHGKISFHHWENKSPCDDQSRLAQSREIYFLSLLHASFKPFVLSKRFANSIFS